MALARDDEVGRLEAGRQPGHRRHQVETGQDTSPQGGEAPRQAAGRPGALDGVDVDAEVPPVAVGQGAEAVGQHHDLPGRRALLRPEHRGGVDEARGHVAGHLQLDALQGGAGADDLDGAPPPVGGGRAAAADDDPGGAGVAGAEDEVAHARCVRRHGVVAAGIGDQ